MTFLLTTLFNIGKFEMFHYRLQHSCGKVINVFTHVCHSVYMMGVYQTPNLGRHPLDRNPPLGRPSPGQTPSLGRHPLGRHLRGWTPLPDANDPVQCQWGQ